jgi:predicted transcriptional regulator
LTCIPCDLIIRLLACLGLAVKKKSSGQMNLKVSIVNAIKESGLTQVELSEKAGVPQVTISRFIRGKGFTIDNASKICAALGLVLVKSPNDTPRK